MPRPLEQHQIEMEGNKLSWDSKPLIRRIYAAFYAKITEVREALRRVEKATATTSYGGVEDR